MEATRHTGKFETVYNLRVADFHTYFVGGEEWGFSVWAHNTYTNQSMRDAVNKSDPKGWKSYLDPFTNLWKRTRQLLVPDHIFPAKSIEGLKGYERLSRAQQLELLTDMKNIQALKLRVNASKGAKPASEWTQALGRPIDPNYTASLVAKHAEMKAYFIQRITGMLG